jgi:hypothetical protein
MRGVLARIGSGPAGPVRLAVVLSIAAIPFVGLSLLAPPIFEVDEGFQPPSLPSALVVAAIASIAAAVIAGSIGGLIVRRHPTLGALVALGIAWPVAIIVLPMAAAVLRIRLETAYSCFDTCGPMLHTDDVFSGAGAYLVALFVSAVTIVPLIILPICVYGAYKLNQGGYPFVATLVLGIGYGAMHWLAVLGGAPPLIGFVALLLGVAAWTSILRAAPPVPEAPQPAPAL